MESKTREEGETQNTPFLYEVTTKEYQLDTFGHVNHAVYVTLFEEARWAMCAGWGCGIEEMWSSNLGPIVIDAHLRYRKELRARETVTIETICTSVRGKLWTLRQRMINSKGQEACTGEFTFGLFDRVNRKLVRPTEKWLGSQGIAPKPAV